MDRKDYYNEKFELHIHWNSNEIIAILGNFLNYKIWHILLEHFNSVSANYKPFIPDMKIRVINNKSAKLLNI